MSPSRHTEAEMIGALKQMEARRKAEEVARKVASASRRFTTGRPSRGGMEVSQAQEVKKLREENTRRRELVADLSLD